MITHIDSRSPMDEQSEATGPIVSESNLNPVLQIVTVLLLATTGLMLAARLLTSFFLKSKRSPGSEDILILVSFAFGIAEAVTVLVPESRVLGQDQDHFTFEELKAARIIGYVRDLLFIVSLGTSKWSVSAGLKSLSPDKHRRTNSVFEVVIMIWITSTLLAVALQCGRHGPWNGQSKECIDQHALLDYIAITSIITDVALMIIPVAVVWPLQMALRSRITIISFFWLRIVVIVATAGQLVYLPGLFGDNPTLRTFPYYLCMELVQFLSISAACVVYFLPFLRSLQSGLVWADGPAPNYLLPAVPNTAADRTNEQIHPSSLSGLQRRQYIEIKTETSIVSQFRNS